MFTFLSERLLAQYRLRRHTESAFLGEFACLLVAVFGRQGGVMRKDIHYVRLGQEYFFATYETKICFYTYKNIIFVVLKLKGMDAKITLSFNEAIISKAKKFADDNNISLSRLTEFLYSKITSSHYKQLEDLPVADWVSMLAEGEVKYQKTTPSRKSLKKEYYKSLK